MKVKAVLVLVLAWLLSAAFGHAQVRRFGSTTLVEAQGFAKVCTEQGDLWNSAFSATFIYSDGESQMLVDLRLQTEGGEALPIIAEGERYVCVCSLGSGWVALYVWDWGVVLMLPADSNVRSFLARSPWYFTWFGRVNSAVYGSAFGLSIGPKAIAVTP